MKSIKEIEKEIISDFQMFDDWTEKYEYLIELGPERKNMFLDARLS